MPTRLAHPTLATGLLSILLSLAFAYLGMVVPAGGTQALDWRLLQSAQALRGEHLWIAEIMRDFSGLGSTVVLILITVMAVAYLAQVGARLKALMLSLSAALAWALVGWFKEAFERPRPEARFSEVVAHSLSFPSGHASMSAVIYLTLGALLASTHARRADRVLILGCAALITFLVGLSRVALGVHWASDVLGGWAFGAGWALAWLLLTQRLLRAPAA